MRLSRVFLTRGSQKAILQGMIHIAPDKLYEVLQSDVDWATGRGYQIFFEGVKRDPSKKASTSNERKIEKFFLLLLEQYPVLAATFGVSLQKEKIAYPKDAINADIDFFELTRQLDENGFRCNFLLWLFTALNEKEPKRKGKDKSNDKEKEKNLNELLNSSEKSFSKFIAWLLFRKAMPVIVDYRNEVVAKKIRACQNGRSIFVHYGEKHIQGLVNLLEQDGWNTKETAHIDLAEYC